MPLYLIAVWDYCSEFYNSILYSTPDCSPGVRVGMGIGAIKDGVVVHGPQALIGVLMGPEG